ncbi:MAG: TrmH family RNA methyltransferase [Parachlamydiales bacterium]
MLTSLQNPKVKEAIRLRERRARDKGQKFLIEGYRELTRALEGEFPCERLFVCPEFFLGTNEPALIESLKARGTEVEVCSKRVFEKLSYRDRPDGLLAIAPQVHRGLNSLEGAFFLVAEAIEKPGNLGTLLRSADAVGVDGVILCDRCTDLFNPNVVRASVGTLFTQPVVEAEGEETREWLKKRGIQIVAATPHVKRLYTEADLSGPIAIVVGTEQLGLSQAWMEAADIQVAIPMRGAADSLNVATATTVLLYEALRQR